MNFSVVLIARNEEKTLPRLLDSLKEFQEKGGEIIVVDTGSTDKTAEVARSYGCKVEEVGDRFKKKINSTLAKKINRRFVLGEEDVVKEGEELFDFASARNYAASLASNDWCFSPDCDEVLTAFDLDEIEKITSDQEQNLLEYDFVFAHDEQGNPTISFLHSKFYRKSIYEWRGVVHEILANKKDVSHQRKYLPPSVIKLEHFQNEETNRGGYLKGLALDCYENPDNDRNSHYFGREMVWTGRPKSGIKELRRHIAMDRWPAEKAQSMVFIADAYGMLNEPENQVKWLNKAFYNDSTRRVALIKLAEFYLHNKNYQAAVCYAKGAMEIPWSPFYANNMEEYQALPHEILYKSYGWLGRVEEAKEHISKALEFKPMDRELLRDVQYYFDLPTVSVVIPQLGREEGLKKCIDSIKNSNYPQELIDIEIIEGDETVPIKVKEGVEKTKGEYILYAANDIILHPNDIITAVWEAIKTGKALVALNTGVRNPEGYICEHFIIRRDFIPTIGEVFDTEIRHYGCDDLLWKKCEKLGQATIAEHTRTEHIHFSRLWMNKEPDEINKKALSYMKADRALLKKKLAEL